MATLVLTGESITQQARDLVIDGQWDRAIALIHNAFVGITMDHIVPVLKGIAKFVGRSPEMDWVECEADPDYAAEIEARYGNVFKWGDGHLYVPYGYVSNFGWRDGVGKERDWDGDPRKYSSFVTLREIGARRSRYYCESSDDIVILAERGKLKGYWVLCERFREALPTWITPKKSVEAFIIEAMELEEFGFARSYPGEEPQLDPQPMPWADDRNQPVEVKAPPKDPEPVAPFTAAEIAAWRAQITAQAGSGWFTLEVGEDRTYRVPYLPFRAWALDPTGRSVTVPWKPVCPEGIKQYKDNVYHSDFLVGMGMDDPRDYYTDLELKKACEDLASTIYKEATGFEVHVLSGTGVFAGECVHAKANEELQPHQIAVIPHASADYYISAMTAGAVITQTGGTMSHLIVESLLNNTIVVRRPDALQVFDEGTAITIDAVNGRITGDVCA